MENPKISFIVLVYWVEKTLNACVGSILAQSMPNFELFLIDDGSPDQSGKIYDKIALQGTAESVSFIRRTAVFPMRETLAFKKRTVNLFFL